MPRYSAEPSDPGYANFLKARENHGRLEIFIDGIKQRSVITADEEAGILQRHAQDKNGNDVRDKTGTHVLVETVHGRVMCIVTRGN